MINRISLILCRFLLGYPPSSHALPNVPKFPKLASFPQFPLKEILNRKILTPRSSRLGYLGGLCSFNRLLRKSEIFLEAALRLEPRLPFHKYTRKCQLWKAMGWKASRGEDVMSWCILLSGGVQVLMRTCEKARVIYVSFNFAKFVNFSCQAWIPSAFEKSMYFKRLSSIRSVSMIPQLNLATNFHSKKKTS